MGIGGDLTRLAGGLGEGLPGHPRSLLDAHQPLLGRTPDLLGQSQLVEKVADGPRWVVLQDIAGDPERRRLPPTELVPPGVDLRAGTIVSRRDWPALRLHPAADLLIVFFR